MEVGIVGNMKSTFAEGVISQLKEKGIQVVNLEQDEESKALKAGKVYEQLFRESEEKEYEKNNDYLLNNYAKYEEYFEENPEPKKLRGIPAEPARNSSKNPKQQRNDLCLCGSGIKYKKCCGK